MGQTAFNLIHLYKHVPSDGSSIVEMDITYEEKTRCDTLVERLCDSIRFSSTRVVLPGDPCLYGSAHMLSPTAPTGEG